MERRRLGPGDLLVGEIGLGCMSMSWVYLGDATEDESIRELLGRALEGHREDAAIVGETGSWTKRMKYLEENVGAAAFHLTPEDLAELEALPASFGSRY